VFGGTWRLELDLFGGGEFWGGVLFYVKLRGVGFVSGGVRFLRFLSSGGLLVLKVKEDYSGVHNRGWGGA